VSNKKRTEKKSTFLEHYGLGKAFTMLSSDILVHPAYHALYDKHRLILFQLLTHLSFESARDSQSLLQDGFSYTWKMCKEQCSESTFSAAMKNFICIGWIEHNIDEQKCLNWEHNVYRISQKWRTYTLSDEEFSTQQKKVSYKEGRLSKKKTDKATFIMKFFTPND